EASLAMPTSGRAGFPARPSAPPADHARAESDQVKVVFNGRGGKVGRVLAPALEAAGHELVELDAAEAMVDFTVPDAVEGNVRAALERAIPCVIGTSGFDQPAIDALAREHGIACFYGPNF